MSRVCSNCSSPITWQSKSGLCRPCSCRRMVSDPEINARRLASLTTSARTPEIRARISAGVKAYCARPEEIERRRALGRKNWHLTIGSENGRNGAANLEVIARRGAKLSETLMGWCPPEYRAEYRELFKRNHNMTKERARKIILDRIEAKKAAMSPFERQMEALRNGARLVEKPILRRPDYAYTLGGVVGELG